MTPERIAIVVAMVAILALVAICLSRWGRRQYEIGQEDGWKYRGALEGPGKDSLRRLISEYEASIHRLTQGCAEDSARIEELEAALFAACEQVGAITPDYELVGRLQSLATKRDPS